MFNLTTFHYVFATLLSLIPTIFLAVAASCLTSGHLAAQNFSFTQLPAGQEELPTPQVFGFQDPANRTPQIEELPVDENMEVLMRGPLHEAFAEVYQADPSPGVVLSKPPPQPIHELPPEFKPEGNNVEWIPGYWAFDDEQQNYLWISGVWRDIPPGSRWIGGYWEESEAGYRWISGFWTDVEQQQITYLPPPPANIDVGPSVEAPGEEYFYVPGNWVYQQNNYAWRSGSWSPRYENWVWIPSQYVWTPNGCIYRAGYWDYQIDCRGTVFAPVQFRQPLYQQPGYYYTPSFVINTDFNLLVHLFVRPQRCHYYFGDWYADRYRGQYQAWIDYPRQSRHYDPLFAYYSSRHATWQNQTLLGWINDSHRFYANNVQDRPPHTYRAQREFSRQQEIGRTVGHRSEGQENRGNDWAGYSRNAFLGRTLDEQVRQTSSRSGNHVDLRSPGFERLDREQRDQAKTFAEQLTGISVSRKQVEHTDRPENDVRPSADRNRPQGQLADRRNLDLPQIARTNHQRTENQPTENARRDRDSNSQARSGSAPEEGTRSRSNVPATSPPGFTRPTQNQSRQSIQPESRTRNLPQQSFQPGSRRSGSPSDGKQSSNNRINNQSPTNQNGSNGAGRSDQVQGNRSITPKDPTTRKPGTNSGPRATGNRSITPKDPTTRKPGTNSGPRATGNRSSTSSGQPSSPTSSSRLSEGKSSAAPSASTGSTSKRSTGTSSGNRSPRSSDNNGNRDRSSGGRKN